MFVAVLTFANSDTPRAVGCASFSSPSQASPSTLPEAAAAARGEEGSPETPEETHGDADESARRGSLRRSSLGALVDGAKAVMSALSPFAGATSAQRPPRSPSAAATPRSALRVKTLARQASSSSEEGTPPAATPGGSMSRRKSVSFDLTPRHRAPGSYTLLDDAAADGDDSPVPPTPHFAPVPILKRDMSVRKAALPSPGAAASAGARLASVGFTTVVRRARDTVQALLGFRAASAEDAAAGRAALAPQQARDFQPLEDEDDEGDGAAASPVPDEAEQADSDQEASDGEGEGKEERRRSVGIYERLYSLHDKGEKKETMALSSKTPKATRPSSKANRFDLQKSLMRKPGWQMKTGRLAARQGEEAPLAEA